MNSRLKQVAAVVKLSAKFRYSAWRSNKTLSELNTGMGDEIINPPQILLHNEDEGKDSLVSINESSMVVDETCNTSCSELAAKLRAERISRPQIALSNEDDDENSFVGMNESSMAVDETYISSWSEETAKLRAEKTNRPQIIFSDDDEDENSFVGMDESSMAVDETYISSWSEETAKLRAEKTNRSQIIFSADDEDENNIVSMDESSIAVDQTHIFSSSSSVPENYSKFKRPSSVLWTEVKVNANRVSLIGSICNQLRFKYTDSGQSLVWTSIDMRDENFRLSGRLQLYFLDELADIAKQHLKFNDCVYVSGEFVQLQHKIWVRAEDLKFIQWPDTRKLDTRNTANNSKPEAKGKMETTAVNPVKDSKPEANAKVESATVKPVKDITTAQKAPTEVKESATSNKPTPPKEKVAAATNAPPKPLPEMMAEDVIPAVKAILEKEEDISDIKLVFEDKKLEGSFANGEIP